MALVSLWLLIALVFVLNLFKQAVRGPVVALMPDMIPGDLRSEANGVINTMGGIATIVGTVGLACLMDIPVNVPGFGPTKEILAFPSPVCWSSSPSSCSSPSSRRRRQ